MTNSAIAGRIAGHLAVLLVLAGLLAACKLPAVSKSDIEEIKAGENAIVLVRITGEEADGTATQLGRIGSLSAHDFFLALGDFESGGVPTQELFNRRALSDRSADQGWFIMELAPGTYYLAVSHLFIPYHSAGLWQVFPRWSIGVPDGARIVYAGSLHLRQREFEVEDSVFGNYTRETIDGPGSEVRNEEELAQRLIAQHLGDFGPAYTVLMQPHTSGTYALGAPKLQQE